MFAKIPSTHSLMQTLTESFPQIQAIFLKRYIQSELDQIRIYPQKFELETVSKAVLEKRLVKQIKESLQDLLTGSLVPVINATGIVLHTNLGRAPLTPDLCDQLKRVARYTNLEYDLKTGRRGQRTDHLRPLLQLLTGAEDGLAVNNNAAAVMLMLNTVGRRKEVVLSRGEMVEIGGSFRLPEVMKMSGCKLKEIGATNKTHLQDYEQAISSKTAAILICHTSNYEIQGFTEKPALTDLINLAQAHEIPLIYDLGSGAFEHLEFDRTGSEPLVAEIVAAGVDLVSFSGDKLLGGPQAGLIVGKQKWIKKCEKNHLLRALRLDKLLIKALQNTLILHLQGTENILTQGLLNQDVSELEERSKKFIARFPKDLRHQIKLVPQDGKVGSGAYPVQKLSSWALQIKSSKRSAAQLARALRIQEPPVIGYIDSDYLHLDLRAVQAEEETLMVKALIKVLE